MIEIETKYIFFVGHQESGKSTIANAMIDILGKNYAIKYGLSDPIYQTLLIFGFTMEQIMDKKYRNVPQECFGGKTIREFMKHYGDGMRDFYEDIWVNKLEKTIADNPMGYSFVINDNVRYSNEFNYFCSLGKVHSVAVDYPTGDAKINLSHRSESSIPELKMLCDYRVNNTQKVNPEIIARELLHLMEIL